MKQGINGGYGIIGVIVAILCIISCVSLVVFSGILDKDDEPRYVLAEGDGTVQYRAYDESSLEEVVEFTVESDDETVTVTLFLKDSAPIGYTFIGNCTLDDVPTKMYGDGNNTVYIHDGSIIRLDIKSGTLEYTVIRSDLYSMA